MSECGVRRLMRSLCNEECSDWDTCPIAREVRRIAIRLFAGYDPEPKEADTLEAHKMNIAGDEDFKEPKEAEG